MAFTYNVATDIGKVRLLVGDTDSATALLQDDEVEYFLEIAENNVYLAASYAAGSIAGKYSRQADVSVESVSKKYSQQSMQYMKLSLQLESRSKRVSSGLVSPGITGISRADIITQRENEDRVQEKFNMDRFSNPPNQPGDDTAEFEA